MLALARVPRVVALGEMGLDFHYDLSPRDLQARVFRTHIEAARITKLPLVIHARDCDDDMIRILADEMGKGTFPAVLHCFSSGPRLAEIGVELGLSVSLSGILTFKKSDEIRAIAKRVPLDRLLVETDAPFLTPMPHRGKPNEPALMRHTAEYAAGIFGVELEEIAAVSTRNARAFFGL